MSAKAVGRTRGRQAQFYTVESEIILSERGRSKLEACAGKGNLDTLGEYAREHMVDRTKLHFVNPQS